MLPSNRSILFLIAAICAGLIGVALYLQHTLGMRPCPLCVIQRYLFIAVGLACLIGAAAKRVRAGAAVALVAALGGLGVAIRHLYVVANPGFSCGIDPMETMLNKIPTATLLPGVFRADGLCEAAEIWAGLSIPHWSAVWFSLLWIALAGVLLRRKR